MKVLSPNEDPRESELNSGKRPKIEPLRQIVTYVIAKGQNGGIELDSEFKSRTVSIYFLLNFYLCLMQSQEWKLVGWNLPSSRLIVAAGNMWLIIWSFAELSQPLALTKCGLRMAYFPVFLLSTLNTFCCLIKLKNHLSDDKFLPRNFEDQCVQNELMMFECIDLLLFSIYILSVKCSE